MAKRNLSDVCTNCRDNDRSISKCMARCGVPLDILVAVEHERNRADGKIMNLLIDRRVK